VPADSAGAPEGGRRSKKKKQVRHGTPGFSDLGVLLECLEKQEEDNGKW